jgi:RNA polymerase sigma-70 factor (ECF subfamily)
MTVVSALLFGAAHDPGPARGHATEEVLGAPEGEILRRLARGEESVFERLYQAFRPRLVAIATAYVGEAVAEELAQDVLLRIWEQRDSWAPQHGIAVYLYAAVRNRALKQVRRQGVAGRLELVVASPGDDIAGMGAAEPRPDERVERDDLLERIDVALARLPELGRTAFTLRWIHQLAYEEIAAIMEISEAAVRKQVSRTREALIAVLRA